MTSPVHNLYAKAVSVYDEARYLQPITGPEAYEKRIPLEVIGFLVPCFRSRRFWLRAAHYYSGVNHGEAFTLLREKNKIYGTKQLHTMGTLGILIRSLDKIERIKNIQQGATSIVLATESVKDSYIDLFNYAVLAVLLLDKRL